MPSVQRVLMHSLASTVTPEANQMRREELLSINNPARRVGALALHDFASKRPTAVASFLGLDYQPSDLAYVGSGCECTVFRLNEAEVLKVDWLSVILSRTERKEYDDKRRGQHSAMANYLGEFAVPQTSFIDVHPDFPNREAVQTTQAFMRIGDPEIFSISTPHNMAQRLEQLEDEQPDTIGQLSEFVERSHALYASKHRLLPDVNGSANLVVDHGGNYRMIDGQPIGPVFVEAQSRALNRLSILASALALAV